MSRRVVSDTVAQAAQAAQCAPSMCAFNVRLQCAPPVARRSGGSGAFNVRLNMHLRTNSLVVEQLL